MTVAFVFPGQGTDIAHVVTAWRERSAEVRRLLDAVARAAGLSVDRLTSDRALARTEWQQPVITAVCLGIHLELEALGTRPDVVAGHSLGEVAACAAAGCLSPEAAVELAAIRGRLMAREAASHPGGMLAVRTAERAVAEELVALAREHGVAGIAAHNGPDQWVIAGDWPALRAVAARSHASVLTMPLPIAGAWHSSAMAGAVEEYREALRAAITMPLRVPVVANHTGHIVRQAAALVDLLAAQLTHPVQWVASVGTLVAAGVRAAVTVGPAKSLQRPTSAVLGSAAMLHAIESPEDMVATRAALAERSPRVREARPT